MMKFSSLCGLKNFNNYGMAKTLATQKFVEVKEIRDGTVHLKRGGLRKVLMVGGINFDLKSEEEQQIILNGFQSFLNTLDFSVQFLIHSRKVNIESYLDKIKERKEQETNDLLKIQIEEYIEFIRSFVEENPIITKTFFVVVPYSWAPSAESAAKGILGIFKKSQTGKEEKEEESLEKSVQQLSYRVNQVIEGLEQIDLVVKPLNDDELTELFYNLYNPELTEKKGMGIPKIK